MSAVERLSDGGGADAAGARGDPLSAAGAPALAPSRSTLPSPPHFARWIPGQLLYHAPGVSHPDWATSSEEARDDTIRKGRPVLLIDLRRAMEGVVLVDDGRAVIEASPLELVAVSPEDVVPLSRRFAHASASPSPRCDSPFVGPTLQPSPLAWLSPAGLQDAGERSFEVPRAILRHVVGRGGATIRRLEAVLGVLVGVMDCPGDSATVSLCGPPDRLVDAARVVRLVGQGHRSLLARLEEGPGMWAGSGPAAAPLDDGDSGGMG